MKTIPTSLPDVAFRPSLLSHLRNLMLSVSFIVFGLPLARFISQAFDGEYTLVIWAVFVLFGLLFLLQAAWRCFNQRLCLCNQYVSSYSGILSPRMKTTRLLYEHVRGVEIDQSLYQRCINLGDLHVGSDVNKGEGELLVCGIRNPDAVKDQLLKRVKLIEQPAV